MRKIVPAALAAFLFYAPAGTAAEPAADTVEELRRLNGAVERMTVLMERLVDERRTEVLQRQLAIDNERLAEVEARLKVRQDELNEYRAMEASFVESEEQLAGPAEAPFDAEIFRQQRKRKLEETRSQLEQVRSRIAEHERRVRDLETEVFALRQRGDELAESIRTRLGLAP